ncbi:MAG: hypothetical protein R2727_08670 [Bacteroidales bacterium]
MTKLRINRGITMLTRLGINTLVMMATVVTCPPIQSMMVVTSPMGDHRPPAFAAITIILAKNHLVPLSGDCLRRATITIVVRLSSAAERKNVRNQNPEKFNLVGGFDFIGNNLESLVLVNSFYYCHGTKRKKSISAISIQWYPVPP